MNNLFDFATSELSQDAFICWLFNWYNDGENDNLKQIVKDICREKFEISDISSIDIYRQFSEKVEFENEKFHVKIDVLLVINGSIAIIIEDKTYTSEHGNQIDRYKKGLKIIQDLNANRELIIEEKPYKILEIKTVFWKTGFFYDCDKRVVTDVIVDSKYLLKKLKDYRKESEVIDMYVQSLINLDNWYIEHAKYWDLYKEGVEKSIWNTNICRNHIAQYKMMREFFPEDRWNKRDFYYLEHGTSYGRPWTELWIYQKLCDSNCLKDYFEMFWRIDTSKNGSYISLRLYKREKGEWDDKYNDFKEKVKNIIINSGLYNWNNVDPGKTNLYKEADIAHFTLDKERWMDEKDKIINIVRLLNDKILEFAIKKYGQNKYEI